MHLIYFTLVTFCLPFGYDAFNTSTLNANDGHEMNAGRSNTTKETRPVPKKMVDGNRVKQESIIGGHLNKTNASDNNDAMTLTEAGPTKPEHGKIRVKRNPALLDYNSNVQLALTETVERGSTYRMDCNKTDPAAKVQWMIDGVPVNPHNWEMEIYSNGTLEMRNFQMDRITFQCIVTKPSLELQLNHPITLLLPTEDFARQPQNLKLRVDTIAGFQCRSSNINTSETSHWYKDGDLLILGRGERIRLLNGTNTLIIVGVKDSDAGDYHCELSTSTGSILTSRPGTLETDSDDSSYTYPHTHTYIRILSRRIRMGESHTMECFSKGKIQNTSLTWTKDGQTLIGTDNHIFLVSGSVRIMHFTEQDQGIYKCYASHDGSPPVYIMEATVRAMAISPMVVVMPQPATITINTNDIHIEGHVAGNPTVEWYRDGIYLEDYSRVTTKTMGNMTTSSVKIEVPTASDAGFYQSIWSNDTNLIYMHTMVLPSNADATTRSSAITEHYVVYYPFARFTCSTHDLNAKVTLMKDAQPATIFGMISVLTLGRYINHFDVYAEDTGFYQCIVHSPTFGTIISRPSELTIQPRTSQLPRNLVVNVNSTAAFECKSYTNKPTRVTWYKDDKKLAINGTENRKLIEGRNTLLIPKVNERDRGSYRCSGRGIPEIPIVTLTVGGANFTDNQPSFVLEPQQSTHEFMVGETHTIECLANSPTDLPPPSISWYKDGSLVGLSTNVYLVDHGNLRIKNMAIQHQGTYVCVANISSGTSNTVARSRSHTLEFVSPPNAVNVLPRSMTVAKGDLVMQAQFEGSPPPTIHWYRDGQFIRQSTRFTITSSTTGNTTTSRLEIKNTSEDDAGVYLSISLNKAGSSSMCTRLLRPGTTQSPISTSQDITTTQVPTTTTREPTTRLAPTTTNQEPTTTPAPIITPQRPTTSLPPTTMNQDPTTTLAPTTTIQDPTTSLAPTTTNQEPTTTVAATIITQEFSNSQAPTTTNQEPTTTLGPPTTTQDPTTSQAPATTTHDPTTIQHDTTTYLQSKTVLTTAQTSTTITQEYTATTQLSASSSQGLYVQKSSPVLTTATQASITTVPVSFKDTLVTTTIPLVRTAITTATDPSTTTTGMASTTDQVPTMISAASTSMTPYMSGIGKYSKETSMMTKKKELTTSSDEAKPATSGQKTLTTMSTLTVVPNNAATALDTSTTVVSVSAPKLKQGMDDLFGELKEQRKKLNITFNEMGEKIGVSKIKQTGRVMVAVKDAVGLVRRRSKRQTPDKVQLAMIGFAEQLTQMFRLGRQGIILNDLFVGLTSGATEAAKSNNNLKQKMDDLKNKLGSDAKQAGKDAASNDITNNNGKQTKNIITALTTGVKAMNSKVDDKSVSDDGGSNTAAIAISLFCIVIVIVGIVVFIFWRRRKNQRVIVHGSIGATEAAKSNNNLKQKMDDLKNKLGSDAKQAGKDAASNDITNNNGKQTKNIITALTTGVKAMNSKVDDKSVSDDGGSNTAAIAISLFCIVIVIVGIVVFIFWRRRKNQIQLASDAKTHMIMTEKTQESLCNELTEDTQSETEMTQSESSIKTLKTENKTERSEVRSDNQPVQEEPRQPSQKSDQAKKNQTC